MEKGKIILGVQYLRGFAAIGVLFCHYGSELKDYHVLSKVFNYGQNGVQVFFLISGFIIAYSLMKVNYKPKQFLRFLAKRCIRIDPSYYVTIILTILLFKVLSIIPSFKGSAIPIIPGQFIAHILYIVPFTGYSFYNHVFWTLGVEFQFYLIIGLLYFLSDSKIYKTAFLLIFCGLSFIKFNEGYYIVSTYAPVFCLGISLVNVVNNRNIYNIIFSSIFTCVIAYQFGIGIFILLIVSSLIIVFIDKFNKPLFLLGEISYSLYLTHNLVFIVIAGLLKKMHFDLESRQLVWLLIEVIAAMSFAYLFYQAIEKPSLRLSKKVFYNKINKRVKAKG